MKLLGQLIKNLINPQYNVINADPAGHIGQIGAGGVWQPQQSGAALFSTSFNYSEPCKTAGYGGATNCSTIQNDGISDSPDAYIYWENVNSPQSGNVTEAVAAANNSVGLGARMWITDGTGNDNSEPFQIRFAEKQPELWLRWYMRFQSGFAWAGGNPGYHKVVDMWNVLTVGGNRWIFDADGTEHVLWRAGSNIALSSPGFSWQDVFGTTSDGLFHRFEIHFKADTVAGNDGIFQAWIDGDLAINRNDLNLTDGDPTDGVRRIDISTNQSNPANGASSPMYIDFDNFEIWNTTPPNTDASGNPVIGAL